MRTQKEQRTEEQERTNKEFMAYIEKDIPYNKEQSRVLSEKRVLEVNKKRRLEI